MTTAKTALAAVAFAISGCAGDPYSPQFQDYPEFADAIGVARMLRNGTITLQFPASASSTQTEGGWEVIRPGERGYQIFIDMVGGLKPGETKPIPALPDLPPPNSEIGH